MIRKVLPLIAWILGCELVGILGSLITMDAIPTWYAHLEKPGFTPPKWIFGPVWTTLYLLMGVAAYLIWRQPASPQRRRALILFLIQLGLNGIWTPVFFGLKQPGPGFVVIALLVVAIFLTLIQFYRLNRVAGLLLVPYLIWVSYATALNFSLWQLNP